MSQFILVVGVALLLGFMSGWIGALASVMTRPECEEDGCYGLTSPGHSCCDGHRDDDEPFIPPPMI